jgi:hypothetical protein
MELIILFAIPALIALLQIVLALIAGINLWKQSNLHHPGESRTALRWLAASLIEPTVNGVVIAATLLSPLARSFWNDGLFNDDGIGHAFALTAPMIVLVLPALVAATAGPGQRGVLLKLGVVGAVRWVVTALTLVVPFVIVIGMVVLGFSIWWVKRQGAAISVRYHAIGLGPQGVMVGSITDFQSQGQPPFQS